MKGTLKQIIFLILFKFYLLFQSRFRWHYDNWTCI